MIICYDHTQYGNKRGAMHLKIRSVERLKKQHVELYQIKQRQQINIEYSEFVGSDLQAQ